MIKISVYDTKAKAYRAVSVEDYEKQLTSLGLTDKEVKAKVDKAIAPFKAKQKELNKELK